MFLTGQFHCVNILTMTLAFFMVSHKTKVTFGFHLYPINKDSKAKSDLNIDAFLNVEDHCSLMMKENQRLILFRNFS